MGKRLSLFLALSTRSSALLDGGGPIQSIEVGHFRVSKSACPLITMIPRPASALCAHKLHILAALALVGWHSHRAEPAMTARY